MLLEIVPFYLPQREREPYKLNRPRAESPCAPLLASAFPPPGAAKIARHATAANWLAPTGFAAEPLLLRPGVGALLSGGLPAAPLSLKNPRRRMRTRHLRRPGLVELIRARSACAVVFWRRRAAQPERAVARAPIPSSDLCGKGAQCRGCRGCGAYSGRTTRTCAQRA
eukprot:365834-Chlamydomonas_euryale.AAC.1